MNDPEKLLLLSTQAWGGNESTSTPWITMDGSNCTDGVQWILTVFEECVLDGVHYAAIICGIVSIVAWALNAVPQVIENHRGGRAHEAVSIYLLCFWTVGDCLNLAGCIFTKQLPLQKWMAVFSIGCDILLLAQWFHSFIRARAFNRNTVSEISDNRLPINAADSDAPSGTILACVSPVFALVVLIGQWKWSSFAQVQTPVSANSRRLLFYQPVFVSTKDLVGYIFGCLSSAFYLSSRIPQLIKNCYRRSTDGLSIGLFIFALIGNSTYGAQIFLTSTDEIFILRHFPWILGSLGVMTLDLIMMSQFIAFRNSAHLQPSERLENDEIPILYA